MNIILKDQNGRRLRLFGARLTPAYATSLTSRESDDNRELTVHFEELADVEHHDSAHASNDRVVLVVTDENGASGSQGFGLTLAEQEVALAIAAGKRPGEIARERGTSINTVRNQIRAAMEKCHVTRQVDLARIFMASVR